jgi:hypothetical protein
VTFGDVDLGDGQGKFSVALWFNRRTDRGDATNHGADNVLVAQSSNQNDNFELGSEGDFIEFYLDTTGPDIGTGVSRADTSGVLGGITNGDWFHVVFTYDDDLGDDTVPTATVYVNGQFINGFSGYDGPLAGSDGSPWTLGIARPEHDAWGDFDGLMDEVAVWEGTALTQADVDDLYNGGAGSNTAVALDTATFYATLDAVYVSQALEQTAGVLAPGASIGTTTVNDDYTVGDGVGTAASADPAAAVWEMELDPATAAGPAGPGGAVPHDADFVDVNGKLTLGPDSVLRLLDITGDDFAVLGPDHVFFIAEYDELVGTFGAVEGLPANLVDYDYDGTGRIAVTPEPATLALLAAGGVGVLLRRRRRRAAAARP